MTNKLNKKIINIIIIIILGLQFFIYLINQKPFLEKFKNKVNGAKLLDEISSSSDPVKVINSMGTLNAKGFKNLDYDGKIIFMGKVEFVTKN